jgi:hypothetical protein
VCFKYSKINVLLGFKMISINKKITVLVNSCDAYSDVWPLFFSALNEFWPDRHLELVLNTERKSPNLGKNIKVTNFNKKGLNDSWGLRLIESLRKIETDYVLVVYDDFILESYLDNEELNKLLSKMESDTDIAAVYLTKLGLEINKNSFMMPSRQEGNQYALVGDKVDYRLNSSPAIWRKKDLLAYTGVHDTPWAWEVFGSFRTYGNGKKFYCPHDTDADIYQYNSKKGGAIYRGKWVREVVEDKNKKYNLNIDFTSRGFASNRANDKRSLKWKMNFFLLGYKMIGIKVFIFVFRILKQKLL